MASTREGRIRLGMVGGGQGAFIGYVHRIAARLDGEYELVAGALSSKPDIALSSGAELGFAADRIYTDFAIMARNEAARADGIEAVTIVTPNHMHFAPIRAFLEAGIHVICDKPITSTLEDAVALSAIAEKSDTLFMLTHNYSGYPLVRQARAMVEQGLLGEIRVVQVEYAQDWLTVDAGPHNKQAAWRTDPSKAGAGGCIGDIGTHAFHLACFVTGLKVDAVSADLKAFVPGRKVDDNVHAMLRFESGARGMLWASQVAVGCENGLRLRVYGDKAAIEWEQENPNVMAFTEFGKPRQQLTRNGMVPAGADIRSVGRVPAGHPEGYLEAFACLYSDFAKRIRGCAETDVLPSVTDGLHGMRFIASALQSSAENSRWVPLEP